MVVQAYQNGRLAYDKPELPGVTLELADGDTEIKLWRPGTSNPYKSAWIRVGTQPEAEVQLTDQAEQSAPSTDASDARAVLNADETDRFAYLPLQSPVQIIWNQNVKMVGQVYQEGRLRYDRTHSPGMVVEIQPGDAEVKLWRPGAPTPYKNVWITIVE
ncbi:MAG: hypothetical protein GY801_24625 [bacterium]|nr:hypothetical protein [bacterium]